MNTKYIMFPALIALPWLLTACSGSNNDSPVQKVMANYEIKITNATHGQPLSPPAAILHDGQYMAWSIGSAASAGLETLAESGSPTDLVAEAASTVAQTTGSGVVVPGAMMSLMLSGEWSSDLELTVATMLVNTNDAFTGTTGWHVGDLAVGEHKQILMPIYDAGTETNDELAATIPGPAAGGEGYNPARESHDQVRRHPGVVTQADGYADSALTEAHRFDQGAMLVSIVRTQ
jgi:hypothetical protein